MLRRSEGKTVQADRQENESGVGIYSIVSSVTESWSLMHIVKSIVELHGGSVRAESEGLGKGAAFTVDLAIMPA